MFGPSTPRLRRSTRPNRRGQALVLAGLMVAALLGIMALAIDVGYLLQVRAHLQGMADASALAAAQSLPSEGAAKAMAQQYATENDPDHGVIVAADEVVVGNWDGMGTFDPGGLPTNAVRVVARRTTDRDNSVALFFGKALGITDANVSAWATATSGGTGGEETVTQFILDADDLFKEEAELQLEAMGKASSPQVAKDWYLADHDGNWFIDIPPGTKMEVPTGTQSDPAFWDVSDPSFPFSSTSDPSFQDFLNYQPKSDSWRWDFLPEKMLDTLRGVDDVSHPEVYPEFINPGKCQVSPLNKSDVNKLNDKQGNPMANANGERLGLLAFSIDSFGRYPNGDGNKLPHLWITICDPSPYVGPDSIVTIPFEANQPLRLVQ